MRPWKPDEEIISRAEAEFVQPAESYELVREAQDEDAGKPSMIVESSPLIAQDAASQASLTVDAAKPEDLAANPIEWMASVPPLPAEETPEGAADWGAAALGSDDDKIDIPGSAGDLHALPSPVAPESSTVAAVPASVSGPKAEPPPSPTPAQPFMKAPAQSAEDTAHSIPKQDWADLASSLQTASIEPAVEKTKASPIPLDQHPSEVAANSEPSPTISVPAALKLSAQSAEDTAHSIPKQDWTDLAASLQPKSIDPVSEKIKPATPPVAQAPKVAAADVQSTPDSIAQSPAATTANAEPASASTVPPVSPDPALVEAVVQRVLEKMHPQVVDIITKEFLRPVVQALVHREVTKR
jgi:hypothetical protein